ncbi:RNA-binding protein CP29B, chloroplastic-like [Brassica napus]|uniref:RNA-binding protein CP29B, chloroplastic-like n=1 Tax=Brassica napus TaxID=3708 RepID=UPI000BBE0924|nr:RNA-binding protein CP29B, chloroplastic-like [Brassica napus]
MVLRNYFFTSPWLLQLRLSTFNPKSLPFSISRPASASLLPPSISFKLHSESPSLSISASSFSSDLKLFVGNLPFNVDSAQLFESAGNVEMVEVGQICHLQIRRELQVCTQNPCRQRRPQCDGNHCFSVHWTRIRKHKASQWH